MIGLRAILIKPKTPPNLVEYATRVVDACFDILKRKRPQLFIFLYPLLTVLMNNWVICTVFIWKYVVACMLCITAASRYNFTWSWLLASRGAWHLASGCQRQKSGSLYSMPSRVRLHVAPEISCEVISPTSATLAGRDYTGPYPSLQFLCTFL